jgi:hypothetical protein
MVDRCENCKAPGAEKRELLVRSDASDEVYLCEECYGALEEEFVWGGAATHG